ncbi:MAG: ester cyclase [Acidimicrobiales bacterium]|nr:ester cyclase [Acidimicrobiales bacterium]
MSIDANKDVVRRFYAEVINGRDVDAIDHLLTEDFTHDGEARGRDGQKDAVRVFLAGFSDLHDEILVMVGEGDLVAAHQVWTGTHDGPFAGVPATGRSVRFTSTAVLEIRDGQIASAIDVVDVAGLMGQLTA